MTITKIRPRIFFFKHESKIYLYNDWISYIIDRSIIEINGDIDECNNDADVVIDFDTLNILKCNEELLMETLTVKNTG